MKILELSIILKLQWNPNTKFSTLNFPFIYFNTANKPIHIQILIKLEIADFFSISKYEYKTCIHPIKSPEKSAHVLLHIQNCAKKIAVAAFCFTHFHFSKSEMK